MGTTGLGRGSCYRSGWSGCWSLYIWPDSLLEAILGLRGAYVVVRVRLFALYVEGPVCRIWPDYLRFIKYNNKSVFSQYNKSNLV